MCACAHSTGWEGAGPLADGADYEVIGKGFRNPFRSFVTPEDVLWVTDVGSGDEPETERIYRCKTMKLHV
jgi:hypothetical protein